MARNGSGTYSLPAGNPVVTGTTISSTWANNTLSDIATALTASVANDGQTPILASQNFGGFNISNVGTLTTTNLAVTDITLAGNFLSTGAAKRFQADFSNATVNNRFAFQCSTANAATFMEIIPNGTSIQSSINVRNNSTITNAARLTLFANGTTNLQIRSDVDGAGTVLPISFNMQATQAAQINTGAAWEFFTDVYMDARVFSPIGIAGKAKNLSISASGTSANISVAADSVMLEVSSFTYTARAVSLTINSAGSGANGLDTGSIAASTWYSIWVIYNPTTSTLAGLISLSATAPTMPAGYTYKARIGWTRTDGTANKYPLSFKQAGTKVQYVVAAGSNITAMPQINGGAAAQGAVNTPTWVASSVSTIVPSTAASLRTIITSNGGASGQAMCAPNNSYGAFGSTTNPPPILANTFTGGNGSFQGELLLESTSVYWAQTGNFFLWCLGWEDNI